MEASSSRREALEEAVRTRLEQELQRIRETCLQQKGEGGVILGKGAEGVCEVYSGEE